MKAKPKIVCLGGGNAMPKTVLVGLKKQPVKISAICAMLDSGGSSGRLRKDYNIVAPGDIRRALLALADTSPVMSEFFDYRFKTGELTGHSFANLLITALELSTNDYETTINEIKKILHIKHEVLPVTLDKADLYAVLENNQIIKGEANIDRPKHSGNLKIKNIYLEPKAKVYSPALKALRSADLIIIGPGDLYSTLAQILLVEGITEAILASKAKKVYLCNLMTKFGETNNFSVLDFANQIERWLGGKLDFVLYNDYHPEKDRIKDYKKGHGELLDIVKIDEELAKSKFIGENLLYEKGPIEHDPEKISKILLSLI